MRRALGVGVAVLLTLASTDSSAQQGGDKHPTVSLDVDPCVEADRGEVRRILRIELDALLIDPAPGADGGGGTESSSDTTRVTVGCKTPLVEIRVDDPITGKALWRSIDLAASSPAARARLLAIAVAELISASWTELESNPQPTVVPAGATASAAAREAASLAMRSRAGRPATSVLRLLFALEVRGWLPKTAPALGAGLRAAMLLQSGVGWSVDVMGAHGRRSLALGEISFDTASVGATIFMHRSRAAWSLRAGPGLRLGVARLSGAPASDAVEGGSVTGPFGGPMASGALSVTPTSGVVLELAAEAGYGLLSVRGLAAGVREVAVAGPSLAGGLSVGFFR